MIRLTGLEQLLSHDAILTQLQSTGRLKLLEIALEKARVKAEDRLYRSPDLTETARLASRIMLKENFEAYVTAVEHDDRLSSFVGGRQKHLNKEETDEIFQIARGFLSKKH